ncbi:hypothetical protein [Luteolibacter sp. Populi]|uniref:hypothetical protein n=1 Tax=Luteolibacter sp. Populi TaxID=3230487 RepID=UPI0034679C70
MKLALHRSLIFWSGILVMGFIVWAWRDSAEHTLRIMRGEWSLSNRRAGMSVQFHQFGSYLPAIDRIPGINDPVVFAVFRAFPPPHFLKTPTGSVIQEEIESGTLPDLSEHPSVRELDKVILHRAEAPGSWILFIPHWLILTGVAGAWSGLLVWRARRRRACSE